VRTTVVITTLQATVVVCGVACLQAYNITPQMLAPSNTLNEDVPKLEDSPCETLRANGAAVTAPFVA